MTLACEMLGKGRAQGGILGENMGRFPHVGEVIANPAQSLEVLAAPPHVDNKKAVLHFAGDHASGIIRAAPRLERRIPTHDAARIVWGPLGARGKSLSLTQCEVAAVGCCCHWVAKTCEGTSSRVTAISLGPNRAGDKTSSIERCHKVLPISKFVSSVARKGRHTCFHTSVRKRCPGRSSSWRR